MKVRAGAGSIGGIAGGLAGDLSRNFSVSTKTMQEAARGAKLASEGLHTALSLHAAAAALLPKLPAPRQQFFRSHLLLQVSQNGCAPSWDRGPV